MSIKHMLFSCYSLKNKLAELVELLFYFSAKDALEVMLISVYETFGENTLISYKIRSSPFLNMVKWEIVDQLV